MRKEVYASLAITDHEIRMLVSEIHNGRLSILKVERVEHQGISDHRIVDESKIINAITKSLKHIETTLQFKILRVLLLVDSNNCHRVTRTFHSDVQDPLGRIQFDNVQHIFQQAMNAQPLSDLELINVEIYRYRVGATTLKKMPLNEKAQRLDAEVDLYYINREHVYQLARIVEESGLEILDVCVDAFAIGKEAGLFSKKVDEYVVAIAIEATSTTLSLFYKERLMHATQLELGYDKFIREIAKSLSIPHNVASRLMFSNVDYSLETHSEYPVYLWSQDKKSFTCSQRDLMAIIKESSDQLFDEIKQTCLPIIEGGPTNVTMVGQGSMLKGIDHRLAKELQCSVECYLPTTLGAREGAFVASLGAFYAYIDHQNLETYHEVSISVLDYEQAIGSKPVSEGEANFSTKLKSFLKDPIKGGTSND